MIGFLRLLQMVLHVASLPGVIFHEIGHRFFCDLCGVPVYEVCYLRAGNPMGFVTHQKTLNIRSSFLIAVGPLILNTVLCSLITIPAVIPSWFLKSDISGLQWVLLWLGLAIGLHAFPSDHDIENFVECVKANDSGSPLVVLARGMGFILQLAHLGGTFFSLLYAIMVAIALPTLAINLLVAR